MLMSCCKLYQMLHSTLTLTNQTARVIAQTPGVQEPLALPTTHSVYRYLPLLSLGHYQVASSAMINKMVTTMFGFRSKVCDKRLRGVALFLLLWM